MYGIINLSPFICGGNVTVKRLELDMCLSKTYKKKTNKQTNKQKKPNTHTNKTGYPSCLKIYVNAFSIATVQCVCLVTRKAILHWKYLSKQNKTKQNKTKNKKPTKQANKQKQIKNKTKNKTKQNKKQDKKQNKQTKKTQKTKQNKTKQKKKQQQHFLNLYTSLKP